MLDWLDTEDKFSPGVVSAFMLIALSLMGMATVIGWLYIPEWYEIVVGIILLLIAIPVHRFGKNQSRLYLYSFFINSIGSGLVIAAYYSQSGNTVDILSILAAILYVILLFFALSFLVSQSSVRSKVHFVAENIFWLGLLLAHLALWINKGVVLFSFGFFAILFVWVYRIVDGSKSRSNCLAVCNLSFGSFGAFIIAMLVVVFILSEGDVVDFGLDAGTFGGEGNSNKKNKKQVEEQMIDVNP